MGISTQKSIDEITSFGGGGSGSGTLTVKNNGATLTTAAGSLDFTGGVSVTQSAGAVVVNITGSKHLISDEGVSLPARSKLNFVGATVTAVDDAAGNQTVITIAGGTTDLTIGTRTGNTLEILSSTGADVSLPSASDTQAGLFPAASKVKLDGIELGAKDDQTAAEVAVTPTGTLTATNVQTALETLANASGGSDATPNKINYASSTETIISGKYFESTAGLYKPMYRKIVDVGFLPNASTKNVSHGLNILDIVEPSLLLSGRAYKSSEKSFIPLPYSSPAATSSSIAIAVNSNNISVDTGISFWADWLGVTVLEYAKISDPEIAL